MERYGTTKECPACGENDFTSKYHDNVLHFENNGDVLKGIGDGKSLILRTCNNCSYTFAEEPLFLYDTNNSINKKEDM